MARFELNGELFSMVPTPKYGLPYGVPLTPTADGRLSFSFPGIMRINWFPTVGLPKLPTDPINLASQVLYKRVQNALRNRTLPFQRTDLMVNILCNDSIHIVYEDVCRMYKAIVMANKMNRYVGAKMVQALGYDFDDVLAHRAEIREYLIRWKRVLDMYPLPNVLNYITVHQDMSTCFYCDAPSDKTQLYVFVPQYVYTYAGVDTGAGKGLDYKEFHGSVPLTWANVKTLMNGLIAAMTNSTDFDVISAAFLSTFEDELTVATNVPAVDDEVEIEFNAFFNNALINAVVMRPNAMAGMSPFVPIDDTKNNLVMEHDIPVANYYNAVNVINALSDAPTSEEMVNYMRWHLTWDEAGYVSSLGTEWLTSMQIYAMTDVTYNGTSVIAMKDAPLDYYSTLSITLDAPNSTALRNLLARLWAIEAFSHHPIVYLGMSSSKGALGTDISEIILPMSDWQFNVELHDAAPYHNALLWSCFAEKRSSVTAAPPEVQTESTSESIPKHGKGSR